MVHGFGLVIALDCGVKAVEQALESRQQVPDRARSVSEFRPL